MCYRMCSECVQVGAVLACSIAATSDMCTMPLRLDTVYACTQAGLLECVWWTGLKVHHHAPETVVDGSSRGDVWQA